MSKFASDDDDLIFFRNAMRDVKRVERSSKIKTSTKKDFHLPKAAQSIKNLTCDEESEEKRYLLSILADPSELKVTAETRLLFQRQGPQHKVIKKLIRGEMPRSACLDLHHMTVEHARFSVVAFLLRSREMGFRCVQIIHGKGRRGSTEAILKNYVNYWLMQIAWVLAFSSAQPQDGGNGAVYVLLAKQSIEK